MPKKYSYPELVRFVNDVRRSPLKKVAIAAFAEKHKINYRTAKTLYYYHVGKIKPIVRPPEYAPLIQYIDREVMVYPTFIEQFATASCWFAIGVLSTLIVTMVF